LGIEEVDATAARDRNQGISFGRLTIELRRLEVRGMRGKGVHDFEMAQFFDADIHQQILVIRILAVQALHLVESENQVERINE
jgi:hypothetical protein